MSIWDDDLDRLEKIRRPGEVLSHTVRRLAPKKRRKILQNLAGSWKMSDDEAETIFGEILARRKRPARGSASDTVL